MPKIHREKLVLTRYSALKALEEAGVSDNTIRELAVNQVNDGYYNEAGNDTKQSKRLRSLNTLPTTVADSEFSFPSDTELLPQGNIFEHIKRVIDHDAGLTEKQRERFLLFLENIEEYEKPKSIRTLSDKEGTASRESFRRTYTNEFIPYVRRIIQALD